GAAAWRGGGVNHGLGLRARDRFVRDSKGYRPHPRRSSRDAWPGAKRRRLARMAPAREASRMRVTMVCLMGTLAFGTTTAAADVPPPPPPARALSGTVLFKEDFTDTTLSRWRADRSGVWSVSNGMLRGVLPDLRQQHSVIEAGSDDWTDVALDVDLCQMRGVDKGAVVRVSRGSGIGVDLRGPGYDDVLLRHREWPLGRATVPLANGVWHHLRLEARGHRYSV